VPHPVDSLDDQLGTRQGRLDVPPPDVEMSKYLARLEGVEDGRQGRRTKREPLACLAKHPAVGCREQRDRLGVVADLPADGDENGLVVADERNDVVPGDVRGRDDHDPGPIEAGIELDGVEAGVGLRGAHRPAVPRTRKDQVVGVFRHSGQLGGALPTERRAARTARGGLGGRDHECVGRRAGGSRPNGPAAGRRADGHRRERGLLGEGRWPVDRGAVKHTAGDDRTALLLT